MVRQLQLCRRVPLHRGHYGDVDLGDLSFLRVGRWEGDLWAGKVKGTAGLFIDERARITFEIAPDRAHCAEIAGKVKAWASALTEPASRPGT